MSNRIILAIVIVFLSHRICAEMFTAITNLKKMIETERRLADDLLEYAKEEEDRIKSLQQFARKYKEHSDVAIEDAEKYVSNPVNAFLLIKRISVDWEHTRTLIQNISTSRLKEVVDGMPTPEDLKGAGAALLRLQATYGLSVHEIARGRFNGVTLSTQRFSADDCFHLGKIAYDAHDHLHSKLWMAEALRLTRKQQTLPEFEAQILDYLAFSKYQTGELEAAYNLTITLLRLDPTHDRAISNLQFYGTFLKDNSTNNTQPAAKSFAYGEIAGDFIGIKPKHRSYRTLCRQTIRPDTHVDSHTLTCQFRRHVPRFYIRPLKEETLHVDPRILLYHDIVVDSEIERIKDLAAPRFRRASALNQVTGTYESAEYRISKSAWLNDKLDPAVVAVDDKIRLMTNLTLHSAELLQVGNYGLGGHYSPHYDFRPMENQGPDGDRIATALCYMSDVELGGATVFTKLGVKILPEKGSCLFWHNLLLNGEGDKRTQHAGCPVLVGSKWVANKWLHIGRQELTCEPDRKLYIYRNSNLI